jgi:non-ribosomal peptide synthetase component F/thioesterase domain-containing protein
MTPDDCSMHGISALPSGPEVAEDNWVGETGLSESEHEPRDEFPCSVAQERFWLLDRLEPGNATYNIAVRWQLDGRLSTGLLERAWLKLIERHEVLRTVFVEVNGEPVQRVLPRSAFKLAEVDLTSLPEAEGRAEADRIGILEARAPFDISAGPMVRATLLRLTPTTAIILVTTHQLVSDGWSIGVMAREMGLIYDALAHDEQPALADLPIQYADYAAWQREWLKERGVEAERAYWSKQLAGIKPFEVQPDRPRSAVPSTKGVIASRVLPRDLTNRAQAMSSSLGVTFFSTALAALTAVLSRYTGQTDIVVGTQVSDRDQVELEPMIGQFVNSLILRTDASGDPSFKELIDRVSQTVGQALENRSIPIEQLLRMVKTGRKNAQSALISVNFIFQRSFIQNAKYRDFSLTDLPSLPAGAIYDLNFFMVERPDGWRASCQYNVDQFDGATAERLLGQLQNALASAADHAQQRISELELRNPGEREELVRRFQGRVEASPAVSLPTLFQTQALAWPKAVALRHGGRQLNYQQLDTEANRLAQYLISRGLGGARVAIGLPRSAERIIAMLAVMKAGGSWVPLTDTPSAQLKQWLQVSHSTAVIGTSSFKAVLPDAVLVEIDGARTQIAAQRPEAPALAIDPQAEVCTLITIREGTPRGVQLPHRALVNGLSSLRARLGIGAREVMVAADRPDAAGSILACLLPLLAGAQLVLATDAEAAGSEPLADLLRRSTATVLHAGPSAWAGLLQAKAPWRPLKMLFDEVPDSALAGRLLNKGGELWLLHGCNEAGMVSSIHRVQRLEELHRLGEPLANTSLYILDARLEPVPVGAFGELCIGGDGVALGAVDGSTGPFVVDPFAGAKALLVRTGQRVRAVYTEQGGYRLETGRREQTATVDKAGQALPSGELEQRIERVWASILEADAVDPTANFFELGGHSLLAARMLARIERDFGRRLSLATLFRAPTIRELARVLGRDESRDFDFRQVVKLQAGGARAPIIAINNTGIYYLLAKRLGPEQPFTSLQLFDPSVKSETLPQTFEGIAAGYVELIRRVQPKGPYMLLGWCVAGSLCYEIAQQLMAAKEQVSNLILIDTWVPNYLKRLPPVRSVLADLALRWNFIAADWHNVKESRKGLGTFLRNRYIVKKMLRAFDRSVSAETQCNAAVGDAETYDSWLLNYLLKAAAAYQPKPYHGRITLFRGSREPSGLFLDPTLGWGKYAAGKLDVTVVEGAHFTIFQDPTVADMARHILASSR